MATLGVIFIHGVGRQRPRQTLARCGGPLSEAIGTWIAPIGVRFEARSPVIPERPTLAATELLIGDGIGVKARWLFAESRWGHDNRVAIVRDVLAQIAYLASAASAKIARRSLAGRGCSDSPGHRRALAANLGSTALRIRCLLVMTVGNFLVRRYHPDLWTALVRDVQADIDWLSARCEQVAVIAHSHGAVIAEEVLSTRLVPGNIAFLVTYGAMRRTASPTCLGHPGRLDFVSRRDPFAGHQRKDQAAANGLRIFNEPSVFTAHWTYWRNAEEFVLPLAQALMECEPGLQLSLGRQERSLADAIVRRRRRIAMHRLANLATVVLLLTALVLPARIYTEPAAWWLTSGLITVAAKTLTLTSWRRWDRQETAKALEPRPSRRTSQAGLLALAASLIAPAAILGMILLAASGLAGLRLICHG
jgi:hypothetical protein